MPQSPTGYRPLGAYAPDDVVAFGPAGERTAGQLLADVASLLPHLPRASPGSHLAMVCEDRYAFAVALLAAWEAGHAVALPPSGRPLAVGFVSAGPDVPALLHDTDAREGIDFRPLLGARQHGEALRPLAADRVIATLFTSGSTGDFEPCTKTARQLFAEVEALQRSFGLAPGERVIATVPPHHLYGLLFSVLWPLHAGAAFGRDVPLHAEAIAARVAEGATVITTVPAHLASFELIARGRLDGVRVFSSTAPLSSESASDIAARHAVALTEIFGSTETGGIAWRAQLDDPRWQPLPNVEVGVEVGVGSEGRLRVTSPFIALPQPYETGDRIALGEGGRFVHLGRSDDVVKVGGRRVALSHLEARLRALPGVKDAAVTSVPDAGRRHARILAAVVAPGWTAVALRDALAAWFEPSTLPRRFALVAALPREATGKLRRESLLALFQHAPRRTLEVLGGGPCQGDDAPPLPARAWGFELFVPPDLCYFDGHFSELAILPGVAVLHEVVLPRLEEVLPQLRSLRRVTRLKFRKPIRPNDRLRLRLVHVAGSLEVDFVVSRAEVVCATGRLRFGGGA